jgi:hypothetical protein
MPLPGVKRFVEGIKRAIRVKRAGEVLFLVPFSAHSVMLIVTVSIAKFVFKNGVQPVIFHQENDCHKEGRKG